MLCASGQTETLEPFNSIEVFFPQHCSHDLQSHMCATASRSPGHLALSLNVVRRQAVRDARRVAVMLCASPRQSRHSFQEKVLSR